MKKLSILLTILALLVFSSTAFATVNTAGSALKLNDTATTATKTTAVTLEISASPKVNLSYLNPDATTFQYFIIGTYHEGGTKLYATAASVTKVYNYTYPDGTVKSFAKLPTTKAAAQSETSWLTTLGFKD